jgi:cytochrome c biogenesis protein CcdA
VVIYFNGGCNVCVNYVVTLQKAMNSAGITEITRFDYNDDSSLLNPMSVIRARFDVPPELCGAVITIIDDKYVFEGYFPIEVMIRFITSNPSSDRVVAAEGFKPDTYRLRQAGTTVECNLSQNIADCTSSGSLFSMVGIWPLVLISGFVDGVNPCAMSVLAYFVGVVFANQSRRRTLVMGVFYILSVYAIYLAIGIGLIRIILFAGWVRIVSRVLGGFIIGLSLLTLANSLGQRIPLKLPRESIVLIPTRLTGSWISKSPIIAAMLFGGVVTALEFPCTGGIYAAIVGNLAVQGTNVNLIAYLLAYNLMFVLPLVILLILLCTVGRFRWMMKRVEQHRHILEGMSALLMLALGILLIL